MARVEYVENSDGSHGTSSKISTVCLKYIPLAGSCSLLGFSTYVMNPDIFKRLQSCYLLLSPI